MNIGGSKLNMEHLVLFLDGLMESNFFLFIFTPLIGLLPLIIKLLASNEIERIFFNSNKRLIYICTRIIGSFLLVFFILVFYGLTIHNSWIRETHIYLLINLIGFYSLLILFLYWFIMSIAKNLKINITLKWFVVFQKKLQHPFFAVPFLAVSLISISSLGVTFASEFFIKNPPTIFTIDTVFIVFIATVLVSLLKPNSANLQSKSFNSFKIENINSDQVDDTLSNLITFSSLHNNKLILIHHEDLMKKTFQINNFYVYDTDENKCTKYVRASSFLL